MSKKMMGILVCATFLQLCRSVSVLIPSANDIFHLDQHHWPIKLFKSYDYYPKSRQSTEFLLLQYREALKTYQKRNGLAATDTTDRLRHRAHCSMPDLPLLSLRDKRAVTLPDYGKLQGRLMTYRIKAYPHEKNQRFLPQKQMIDFVNAAVEKAFKLAHAFYPSDALKRGQIHVDDEEPWAPEGRNLFWVLAHELGHSLGLPHAAPRSQSLMLAQYGGYNGVAPKLFPIDIANIQSLYDEWYWRIGDGDRIARRTRDWPLARPWLAVDAALHTSRSDVYFLGQKYWYDGISSDGKRTRDVNKIDSDLHYVDAAITIPDSGGADKRFSSYIFSNQNYYKVSLSRNSLVIDGDYPQSTARDWFGCPG